MKIRKKIVPSRNELNFWGFGVIWGQNLKIFKAESEHESDDDIQIVPEKVELSKKQKQSQITDFFRS